MIDYKPDCDKCEAPYYGDKGCPFWEGTFCSYDLKGGKLDGSDSKTMG